MGWTYNCEPCSKRDFIAQCVRDDKVIAHTCVGNELWMLVEADNRNVIVLYLLASHRKCWGYKDMDESMHPYYFKCPLAYLGRAPEVNAEWRVKVREYHAGKKNRRELLGTLEAGMTVKLRNCKVESVRLVAVGDTIIGEDMLGDRYRIPKPRIVGII